MPDTFTIRAKELGESQYLKIALDNYSHERMTFAVCPLIVHAGANHSHGIGQNTSPHMSFSEKEDSKHRVSYD